MPISVISVTTKQPFGELQQGLKETTISETYIVKLSENGIDAKAVAATALGVPAIGATYHTAITGVANTPRLISKSVAYLADASNILYAVTCNYSNSKSSSEDAYKASLLPWEYPATYSLSYTLYERPLEKDFSDDELPVVNSVGDLFDPPITWSMVRPKITMKRNSLSSISGSIGLVNSCNDGTETINGVTHGEGECRLLSISENTEYYEDPEESGVLIPYYSQEIEVEIKAENEDSIHEVEVLDCGYRCKVNGVIGRDIDGTAAGNPGLIRLAADGQKIADAETASHYITFQGYRLTDWSGLELE